MEIPFDQVHLKPRPENATDDHFPLRVRQRGLAILLAYQEFMAEQTKYASGYKWNRVRNDIMEDEDTKAGGHDGRLKAQDLQSFANTGGGIGPSKYYFIDKFIRQLELDPEYDSVRERVRKYMQLSYGTFLSDYYRAAAVPAAEFLKLPLYLETLIYTEEFQKYSQDDAYINFIDSGMESERGEPMEAVVVLRLEKIISQCIAISAVRIPPNFDIDRPGKHYNSALTFTEQSHDFKYMVHTGFFVPLSFWVNDTSSLPPAAFMSGTVKALSYGVESSPLGVLDGRLEMNLKRDEHGGFVIESDHSIFFYQALTPGHSRLSIAGTGLAHPNQRVYQVTDMKTLRYYENIFSRLVTEELL